MPRLKNNSIELNNFVFLYLSTLVTETLRTYDWQTLYHFTTCSETHRTFFVVLCEPRRDLEPVREDVSRSKCMKSPRKASLCTALLWSGSEFKRMPSEVLAVESRT